MQLPTKIFVTLSVWALLAACGKPSPAQECQKIVNEGCKKLFQCDPASAQSLGFSSESDCDTKQAATANCSTAVASCNFDSNAVDKCLSDTDALPCNATTQPASCDINVLCPGQLVCSGASVDLSNSGCTVTYNSCTDGHTYGATCPSSTCTCQIDGVNTGTTFTTTTSLCSNSNSSKPIVRSSCNFPFQ